MDFEKVIGIVLTLGLAFVILFMLLSVLTPTLFNQASNLDVSTAGTANGTVGNVTATNFAGSDCVPASESCSNYTGGTASNALSAAEFTWTDSTCSILLVNDSWNATNVQCTYRYYTPGQRDQQNIYTNTTEGIINLSEESTNLVPIAFAIMGLVLLFVAYGLYKRYAG